jgi:hypothetical protein
MLRHRPDREVRVILWFALQAEFDAAAALDRYHEATRATVECNATHSDDILVCARRDADRYRVPLVTVNADDPRNQGVPAERARLIERPNNCQEKSAFLVGCGKVGVGVSSQHGIVLGGERPIAP